MSGVYGSFLLAFPEQFVSVTCYSMKPRVNGGWTAVPGSSVTVKGIVQNTTGNSVKDQNGNLVKSAGMELWTNKPELDGKFTEIKNVVYRLVTTNEWTKEGDFARYRLEKVVGNGGTEPNNTAWNIGTGNFG